MNISIVCSNCGKKLKVAESAAGRTIKCPNPECGATLHVPANSSGEVVGAKTAARYSDAVLRQQEVARRTHEDRRAPGPPPLPPSEIENDAGHAPEEQTALGVIRFEGVMTPRIALLEGERTLDTFEASFWDLGLIGWLLRYKDRLIVTSHRVMRFRKRLIANELSIIWLAQITFARVGQSLNWKKLVIGAFICLNSLWSWLSYDLVPYFLRPGQEVPLYFRTDRIGILGHLFRVIVFLIGAYLVFVSREKVMLVSTGEDKVRIELMRMKPAESRRFVDSVFRAIDARHGAYAKATEPSSTNGATA